MKVKGLDGRTYNLNLTGKMPVNNELRHRSSLHLLARQILRNMYPLERVYEEVTLPGSGSLTADFFVPKQRIIIETHGEQHYKYNQFFHGSIENFKASRKRDERKQDWCELNDFYYIALPFDESEDQWRERISKRDSSRGTEGN